MIGSLLRLLAGDDDPEELEISELASVSPAYFEAQLLRWWYFREPRVNPAMILP